MNVFALIRKKTCWILIALPLALNACATKPVLEPNHLPYADPRPTSSLTPDTDDNSRAEVVESDEPTSPPPTDAHHSQDSNEIWGRIRSGFSFPTNDQHPKVQEYLNWHRHHPNYIRRITKRAEPFLHFIVTELERRGMPYELTLLPAVESAYIPMAYSPSKAAGIWQFIPGTGRRYGLKQNWWYDGRRDVYASTLAALNYLSHLNHRFKETYGTTLWPIADRPLVKAVSVDSQIELALAAELAGMDVDSLKQLNPGFKRWATDPDGPHLLLLPIDKSAEFKLKLAKLPPEHRITWVRHRIKPGENLILIARKYHISVAHIKHANLLRSEKIIAGRQLLVPKASYPTNGQTFAGRLHRPMIQGASSATYPHYHRVRSGETLWGISRQYAVSLKELITWNDMTTNDTLVIGERLTIKSSKGLAIAGNQPTRTIRYSVKTGDSLYRIARRFRVKLADLRRWNDLSNASLLHPGQTVKVHVELTKMPRLDS
jgi:membrane-bound lytic murein transglycosylase D